MANILEAIGSILQSTLDYEKKSPLHVGEVANCWMFLASIHESNIFTQIGINTTTDDELLEMLKDSAKACDMQSKEMVNFMTREGIPSPPLTEKKPSSGSDTIPYGVKLTDDEIANGVAIKSIAAIMICTNGVTQAVRDDVGKMFLEIMLQKITLNTSLKTMMKKRGWIKLPPYFTPPALPNT